MIRLGYEIGSGRPVNIPVNHTVLLGQTQLSGKTTAVEALIARSGLRGVAFITKPGEKSFRVQTPIPAFFSEATEDEYWKHVVAILEYRSGTKLGWRERGLVIKLCQDYKKEGSRISVDLKGKSKRVRQNYEWSAPKSLRDLLANIEAYLPHARGAEEMICIQLREYLRPAIREIEKTKFSNKLELRRGINVMDVTDLSDGLKTLVIRSVIEWVHKRSRKTIVIIPEAWKFIPEGRSTPVKLALEGLIREGAAVENFVWMDSQDLRGVDKMLLRSVIVWLFGVQRQKNEVASTLASIPDHPKPTATAIMQLGKGEFYVCFGNTLKHSYVQPAGMEDAHAEAIARGEESAESWNSIVRSLDEKPPDSEGPQQGEPERNEVHESGEGVLPDEGLRTAESVAGDRAIRGADAAAGDGHDTEDDVYKEKYDALKRDYDQLVEAHDALAKRVEQLRKSSSPDPTGGDRVGEATTRPVASLAGEQNGDHRPTEGVPRDLDAIYRYVVGRAAKEDPTTLVALIERPELQVRRERKRVEASGETLRGALAILICEKFFEQIREFGDVRKECIRRGFLTQKAPNQQIAVALRGLVELGFLTQEDRGYQSVPGMKVNIVEVKAAGVGA